MPEANAMPVSLKCSVCGGDIVNNYLSGTCVCAHCGNKWNIRDMVPDYNKYSRIISGITKANEILDSDARTASVNEAKLLFKTAVIECTKYNDQVTADLVRLCNEGQKRAEKLAVYHKASKFYEDKSYRSAMNEFRKIPGYADSDAKIADCLEQIKAERKKQLPWAVIFSLIIPAALSLFLKEVFGCPVVLAVILFLAGSAGLGYILYRGGVLSVIIKVVSFLCAAPLFLFCLLAYVFKIGTVPAVIVAVAAPIVLFIIVAVLSEKKEK